MPAGWPGWRGAKRDGRAAWLPDRLPEKLKTVWRAPLGGKGLAGLAATDKHVLVAARDIADLSDVFYCLDAATRAELWSVRRPAPGKRLWRVVPPRANDYNVPTPIAYRGQLLVTTENNGTRLYRFDAKGVIEQKPVAVYADLAPETHSPVAVGDRLFGAWAGKLHCLDLKDDLKPIWVKEDDAFSEHVSMMATDHRLLLTTAESELLLIDARASQYKLVSRMKALVDEKGNYSHPAVVGKRLYLRGNDAVYCLSLD